MMVETVVWQAWLNDMMMGEGSTEEAAVEAAVEEYERMIGYGEYPQFADREALLATIEVSVKDDE